MTYLMMAVALAVPGNDQIARYETTNSTVEAPTAAVARLVGERAEAERERVALLWFGTEPPAWSDPCRIVVKSATGRASGFSTFTYATGAGVLVPPTKMQIELAGDPTELVCGPLPQQVAHALIAHRLGFGPRWAETGIAALEPSKAERRRQRETLRSGLADGKPADLAGLLKARDYPDDTAFFYARSFSLTEFLVARGGRATFLAFVEHGRRRGWDYAARQSYDFDDVTALESAWLKSLGRPEKSPAVTD